MKHILLIGVFNTSISRSLLHKLSETNDAIVVVTDQEPKPEPIPFMVKPHYEKLVAPKTTEDYRRKFIDKPRYNYKK